MNSKVTDLFPGTKPKRKRPRIMIHYIDAGYIDGMGNAAHFKCEKCGHDAGWIAIKSVTDAKKGRPCPTCNAAIK